MRLPTDNYRLGADLPGLLKALVQLLPRIATQVNNVSEGRIVGSHNAVTQPPAQGLYQAGDYIRNSAPQVLGSPGSQYVVKGWICVVDGEPGTWVQDQGATGT
jgi:hypothetical protein